MRTPLMMARRSRVSVFALWAMVLLACSGPTLDEQKMQIRDNKITFKGLTIQAFLDTWGRPTYQHRELTVFYLMDDGNSIPRFRVSMGEAPEGWTEGAMAAEGVFFGYADRGELLGFVDGRLVYRQQVPAEEVHAAGKQWAHEQRFKTRLEMPAPAKPVPPPK